MSNEVIIIGAGPAGLTAALEILRQTDKIPVILEQSHEIGGISRTVKYHGNRIDIGGHRFFSKSDIVMNWWREIMPLQGKPSRDDLLLNRSIPLSNLDDAPDPEIVDDVLLVRGRLSRILYLRHFFPYPIKLSIETLGKLGILRVMRIGFAYIRIQIKPILTEKS